MNIFPWSRSEPVGPFSDLSAEGFRGVTVAFVLFKLICRLYAIYVREDNDSNVYVMLTRLKSAVRKRPLNLITHSLTREQISLNFNTYFKEMHLKMSSVRCCWPQPSVRLLLRVIFRCDNADRNKMTDILHWIVSNAFLG